MRQHYYSHLGLRPPSKDFDYNQPLIREGPNDYILLRNKHKKLVRSLQGGDRLTKLGKGFFRDKYYKYLVHVPAIIRGRRRSGQTPARLRAQRLAAGERAGGATRHPAHLTEEQVAQRVRQQVLARPGGPILQSWTKPTFLTLRLGGDVLQSAFEDKPLCVPRSSSCAAERKEGVRGLRRHCHNGGAQEAERRSHRLLFPMQNALQSVLEHFIP